LAGGAPVVDAPGGVPSIKVSSAFTVNIGGCDKFGFQPKLSLNDIRLITQVRPKALAAASQSPRTS
jgi:hypothetical protein